MCVLVCDHTGIRYHIICPGASRQQWLDLWSLTCIRSRCATSGTWSPLGLSWKSPRCCLSRISHHCCHCNTSNWPNTCTESVPSQSWADVRKLYVHISRSLVDLKYFIQVSLYFEVDIVPITHIQMTTRRTRTLKQSEYSYIELGLLRPSSLSAVLVFWATSAVRLLQIILAVLESVSHIIQVFVTALMWFHQRCFDSCIIDDWAGKAFTFLFLTEDGRPTEWAASIVHVIWRSSNTLSSSRREPIQAGLAGFTQ